MEQFLKIAPNIIRCTYTPGKAVKNDSFLVDSKFWQGEEIADFMNPVKAVAFAERDVYHFTTGGQEPVIRVEKTVDGQRTYIENLKEVFDRTAYQATLTLDLKEDEHIFGFGQDEDGVWDLRGKVEYLYQHNMKIPMPMYVSTRGYGVLFDCACLMIFDDREGKAELTMQCVDQVDYYIITGSMVVETIFTTGGLGSKFVSSINNRDYTQIMAVTIFLATLMVIANLICDLVYKLVDPRIKYD